MMVCAYGDTIRCARLLEKSTKIVRSNRNIIHHLGIARVLFGLFSRAILKLFRDEMRLLIINFTL